MPVGDVLVSDTGGNIEHDDTALAVNVISITETTKFLLSGGIPDVELDFTEVLQNSYQRLSPERDHRKTGLTVVKSRGWTSTPRVAMYFFSNSPVRWRLTKVVY